jgi:hypothetical protein
MKKLLAIFTLILASAFSAVAGTLEQSFQQFAQNPKASVVEAPKEEAQAYHFDRSLVCIISDANEMDANFFNDAVAQIPQDLQKANLKSGSGNIWIYTEKLGNGTSNILILISTDNQIVVVFGEGPDDAIENYRM